MTARCVTFASGGHARVVVDAILAHAGSVVGFLDDLVATGTLVAGLPVLGPRTWLDSAPAGTVIALGIGSNLVRSEIAALCASKGLELATVIHPRAIVSPGASLGPGTVVLAGAVVNTGARIGTGCIVNSGAVIEHDCILGDFAHVSPNATLGGGVELGELVHLGLGAVVLPKLVVGARTVVGAGAVVTRSLPPNATAYGVPARVRGAAK
jgi:sugar O-acyltransferase (sialic acid O-acetyltransferase NeuD family)